jgi:hypothetical protein
MNRRLFIPPAAECAASDPTLDEPGWVPIGYDWTGHGPRVIWTNRPNLEGPFFPRLALARWRPEPGEFRQTDFAAIVRRAKSLPDSVPAGFIFHISRCGSTLVSNLARCDDSAVVLSEPSLVSGIFQEQMQHMTVSSRGEVLRALIKLFRYRTTLEDGVGRKVVIKFTAWDALWFREIRAIRTEVPILILVRNPAEVVVSNLRSPATWIKEKYLPNRARRFVDLPDSFDPRQLGNAEFIALALGAQCEALHRSLDDRCCVLDYEDLGPDAAGELASWFGLDVRANIDAVEAVFRTYSKDPSRRAEFVDDRQTKREQISTRIKEMVAKWAHAPYLRLLEHRPAQAASALACQRDGTPAAFG